MLRAHEHPVRPPPVPSLQNVAAGVQDSASPLVLKAPASLFPVDFDLARATFEGTLRIFDGRLVRSYDPETGTM